MHPKLSKGGSARHKDEKSTTLTLPPQHPPTPCCCTSHIDMLIHTDSCHQTCTHTANLADHLLPCRSLQLLYSRELSCSKASAERPLQMGSAGADGWSLCIIIITSSSPSISLMEDELQVAEAKIGLPFPSSLNKSI